MNLIGQHEVTVGDKGRIALPKKIRIGLGSEIIITYGFEQSLLVVAEKNWKSLLSKLQESSLFETNVRDTRRFLFGGATSVELDKQGRFVMPEYLRRHALIESDVVFIGLNSYAEIWDKKRWEKHTKDLAGGIEGVAEALIRKIE